MTAGRGLDALVAEKVFGWSCDAAHESAPHYSTTIATAWMIVTRMRALGWAMSMHTIGPWIVTFEKDGVQVEASAETESLAICLAALKAVGYGEKEGKL